MNKAPILSAEDLRLDYVSTGGLFRPRRVTRAVRGVSLSVERGTSYALIGESGCGKSTMALMLLGLLVPTSGRISIDGTDISGLRQRDLARRVQPVFQDPYSTLNPRWQIGDAVALPLYILENIGRSERRRRALEMLDLVGVPGRHFDKYPSELSGGQRQRVAIARALVSRPEIVICDEPTSALDVSVQAQILNLLIDLQNEFSLSYVIISHNLAVVEHMANRVGVMLNGEIVEEKDVETLFAAPEHPYTAELLSSVLMPDMSGAAAPDRQQQEMMHYHNMEKGTPT